MTAQCECGKYYGIQCDKYGEVENFENLEFITHELPVDPYDWIELGRRWKRADQMKVSPACAAELLKHDLDTVRRVKVGHV